MRETVLSANSNGAKALWQSIWKARELLFFLAWRDIVVKYKQAVLGITWAILRPILTTMVFTLVFGKIARLPSGEIPYPLLVLSGITPWLYFANTVNDCGNSLVANSTLISKVYFPRLVVPASCVIANLVDLTITVLLLCGMLVWFGIGIRSTIVLVPLVVVALALLTVGLGIWAAALNAKYRDVSFIMPFLVTFGLYLSPIGFSSGAIPERWRILYGLNPVVGLVDGFRFALFGDQYPFQMWTLGYSSVLALLLIVTGVMYFRHVERDIVDII
ncbi:ABC transporter permease [Rhizobium sp. Rhizsp42]|uniref:ABC transporter permease n=1 Tax=Rhizobium sp. Rhizsp42 TaxID=3243034 RepID=UPI0039B06341